MIYEPHIEELAQAIAWELEVPLVTLNQQEKDPYRRAAEVVWRKAEELLPEYSDAF